MFRFVELEKRVADFFDDVKRWRDVKTVHGDVTALLNAVLLSNVAHSLPISYFNSDSSSG